MCIFTEQLPTQYSREGFHWCRRDGRVGHASSLMIVQLAFVTFTHIRGMTIFVCLVLVRASALCLPILLFDRTQSPTWMKTYSHTALALVYMSQQVYVFGVGTERQSHAQQNTIWLNLFENHYLTFGNHAHQNNTLYT